MIKRYFFLALYYGFARYLPPSHSNAIGKLGRKIRVICAHNLFKKCGRNINIEHMAFFGKGHGVEIGDNSGIGIHCHVPNDIIIGENVMMGPHCYILPNVTHNYSRLDIPMIFQGSTVIEGRTVIGDDVWIGRQCLFMPCKTIGNHSIIGGGSVVSKDIPQNVVAGGNPIRIIKNR